MPTVVASEWGAIELPAWVTTLDGFRRWVHSGALPEKLSAHYFRGDVWVDLRMEEMFTHNLVKGAVFVGLTRLADETGTGMALSDGMLVTNDEAALGTEPDAMYLLYSSFQSGKVRYTAGETTDAEATELVGSPDLVAEVVSPSSVDKDTDRLMTAYRDAGVGEYWLVDARGGEPRFDIYRRTAKGFVAVRKQDGWVRSPLFGKHFRMTRRLVHVGFPRYTLEIR